MTIDERQQELAHDVAELGDWFEVYEYLIAQGRESPGLDDRFKTTEYALKGCQSQVWIRGELADGKLRLSADSDSLITKGILALLIRVLNDQPPSDIAAADLHIIDTMGLANNLSPSRANGVASIVRRLKELGRECA